jgi:hypothetical protein
LARVADGDLQEHGLGWPTARAPRNGYTIRSGQPVTLDALLQVLVPARSSDAGASIANVVA